MKKRFLSLLPSCLLMCSSPVFSMPTKIDLGPCELGPRQSCVFKLADYAIPEDSAHSIHCHVNPGIFDALVGVKTDHLFPQPKIFINGKLMAERGRVHRNMNNRIYLTPVHSNQYASVKLTNYDQAHTLNFKCSADVDI